MPPIPHTSNKLTAMDYLYMPIAELAIHPDFDINRWIRFLAAHRQARLIIQDIQD